jgi:hypothetical protein
MAGGIQIAVGAPSFIGSAVIATETAFPTTPTAIKYVWTGHIRNVSPAQSGVYVGFSTGSPLRNGSVIFVDVRLTTTNYSLQVQYTADESTYIGEQETGSWGLIDPLVEHEYTLYAQAGSVTLEIDGTEVLEILAADVLASVGTGLPDIIAGAAFEWSFLDMLNTALGEPRMVVRSTALYYQ